MRDEIEVSEGSIDEEEEEIGGEDDTLEFPIIEIDIVGEAGEQQPIE
jgi:hypothetical protein